MFSFQNIPKPSNTLRKTSSERNRQLSALISQTKIVITSPKAERLKTPARTQTGGPQNFMFSWVCISRTG